MSINPSTKYPGRITAPSVEYPHGKAQNITVPGDGTGTPWEKDILNDIFGFQQALLSDAGEVPSGIPDKVGASQYLKVLFKRSGLVRDDYTELRATKSSELLDKTNCFVTGNGIGGVFVLDKTDVITTDDGGMTIVDADGGRWKRLQSGSINIEWFSSVGDDSTVNTTAIQNVIDYSDNATYKVSIHVPDGIFICGAVTSTGEDLNISGVGTLKGFKLTAGPSSHASPRVEHNLEITGVTLSFATLAAGNNPITLKYLSGFDIYRCNFENCDKPVAIPRTGTAHHVRRGAFYRNILWDCNYMFHVDGDETSTATIFESADLDVSFNRANRIYKTHLHGYGIDGLTCLANYLFFPGFAEVEADGGTSSSLAAKEYNIDLAMVANVSINANECFEAGLAAIRVRRFIQVTINGNTIAYPGQVAESDGIELALGDTAPLSGGGGAESNISYVGGNTMIFPTGSGVSVDTHCGNLTIAPNTIRNPGNSSRYLTGAPALSGNHFSVVTDNPDDFVNVHVQSCDKGMSLVGAQSFAVGQEAEVGAYNGTETTIDAELRSRINLDQSGATNISSITGGVEGKILTLLAFNNNSTIVHSAGTIELKGSVNANISDRATLTLIYSNGKWWETGRSF